MSDLVIDTDVVSFGFRQDALYANKYGPAIQGSRAVISFMTLAELQFGMLNRRWGKKRQSKMFAHLQQYYVRYGVSTEICDTWAEVVWQAKQQGRILHSADAWIAATALVLNVPLVTHNAKDFQYLPKLQVLSFSL